MSLHKFLKTTDIISEPIPEPKPFTMTICNGSFKDSIRVQLFSKPQHTQANNTKMDPAEKEMLLKSSTVNTILEIVIKEIAIHICLPTASLKTNKAITAVATISKLFSKDAFAEVVIVRPSIRRIGAAISRAIIPTI